MLSSMNDIIMPDIKKYLYEASNSDVRETMHVVLITDKQDKRFFFQSSVIGIV